MIDIEIVLAELGAKADCTANKGVTDHPATQPVAVPVPWPAPPALAWFGCHRARLHRGLSSAQGSAPWLWPDNQALLRVLALVTIPFLALRLVQQ